MFIVPDTAPERLRPMSTQTAHDGLMVISAPNIATAKQKSDCNERHQSRANASQSCEDGPDHDYRGQYQPWPEAVGQHASRSLEERVSQSESRKCPAKLFIREPEFLGDWGFGCRNADAIHIQQQR